MGMKEQWKGRNHKKQRKERSREREGNLESYGVCVPDCGSALLVTI